MDVLNEYFPPEISEKILKLDRQNHQKQLDIILNIRKFRNINELLPHTYWDLSLLKKAFDIILNKSQFKNNEYRYMIINQLLSSRINKNKFQYLYLPKIIKKLSNEFDSAGYELYNFTPLEI